MVNMKKTDDNTQIKKVAKAPPILYYYEVRVDCMLPATLTYKVLAETPEQAAEMIKNMQPIGVNHKLHGRKELLLKVYLSGTSMLKFMKKMLGR